MRRKKFGLNKVCIVISESSKIDLFNIKKCPQFFWKPSSHTTLESPRSPLIITQKKHKSQFFYAFHILCSTQSSIQAI